MPHLDSAADLHTVTLPDGSRLAYRTAGTGPDVLLLHGWVSSSRMWRATLTVLGEHFRCWAPDLPGCGDSPLPTPESTPTLADDRAAVAAFCAALDLRPYAIIGHSLGGLLALSLAIESQHGGEQPGCCERLILLAPPVSGRLALGLDVILKTPAGWKLFGLWRAGRRLLASLFMPSVFGFKPRYWFSAPLRRKIEDAARAAWPAAQGGLAAVLATDYTPRLGEVRTATLILAGTRDVTVPPAEAARAAAGIPSARLVRLPGVAHQIVDEAPQIAHRHMLDFLLAEKATDSYA